MLASTNKHHNAYNDTCLMLQGAAGNPKQLVIYPDQWSAFDDVDEASAKEQLSLAALTALAAISIC
jgi:hypothetical protein